MLANIISQIHMLARFAMDSNMLAKIFVFVRISNKFNYKKNIYISNQNSWQ